MNTSEYIPFDSVAPIILENSPHCPDMPFFNGTGFFAHFVPFREIFFITAKHCTIGESGEEFGEMKIKYHPELDNNEAVPFEMYLLTRDSENDEIEDLVVYVVGQVSHEKWEILMNRALQLPQQDNVTVIMGGLRAGNGNVRAVGFPSVSKEMDYENGQAVVRPRGFYGKLGDASPTQNRHYIDGLNWKDGELNGFSGAPVLALCPVATDVHVFPIGVLLTGSRHRAHFLSINVATNVISEFLIRKYCLVADADDESRSPPHPMQTGL